MHPETFEHQEAVYEYAERNGITYDDAITGTSLRTSYARERCGGDHAGAARCGLAGALRAFNSMAGRSFGTAVRRSRCCHLRCNSRCRSRGY
jgi:hypothetical protein